MSAAQSLAQAPAHPARLTWPVALGATLAGPVLLWLAFPTLGLGVFAFIALVPLFLLWSKASWKQALWWGWLAGTLIWMALSNWMMHSIGDFVGAWSLAALVFLSVYEGAFVAIAAVLISLVGRGQFRTASIFAAPAAWLVLETLRTRGSLGVPFAQLGIAAARLPWLLPMAAYGGIFLLTALIALGSGALAALVAGTPQARRTGAAVLVGLVGLIAWGDVAHRRVEFAAPHVRVAIAQGGISQREKWTPAAFEHTLVTYAGLTREAARRGARLVVWPETAVTSYPLQEPALLARLASFAARDRVWILTGMVDRPSDQGYYNALLLLTPSGAVGGVYRKRYLVPFAEYLPLDGLLRRIPLLGVASRFISGPGPHLLPAAGMQWGSLICYESAFAQYARATANAGADAIVVATDDAWFGGTSGPYQHADASLIDAVATGRWIVRGADTGISEIIDPRGSVVARLGLDESGIVVGDVGRGVVTAYDRLGAFWLLLLAGLALVAGLWRARPRAVGWRSRRGAR